MSIVFVHKNGVTYAYNSVAKWDPERKQSRPKRTYLGRVDPVTREIIPSAGRKGRRKKEEDPISNPTTGSDEYKARYEESVKKIMELEKELKEAKHRIDSLTRTLSVGRKNLEDIEQLVKKALTSINNT